VCVCVCVPGADFMPLIAVVPGRGMGCDGQAREVDCEAAAAVQDTQVADSLRPGAGDSLAHDPPGESSICATRPGPSALHYILVFAACALPSGLLLLSLSLLGYGMQLYSLVAFRSANSLGFVVAVVAALWLCVLYVFEWVSLAAGRRAPRICGCGIFFALLMAAALLKGLHYPWVAHLLVMSLVPMLLVEARLVTSGDVCRSDFYRLVARCASVTALLLTCVFVLWTCITDYSSTGARWTSETRAQLIRDSAEIYAHIYPERPLTWSGDCGASTSPPLGGIASACAAAETVWFVVWMAPLVPIVFCLLVTCFGISQAQADMKSSAAVSNMLKRLVALLVIVVAGLFFGLYVAGVSVRLTSAFMTFLAACVLGIVIYLKRAVSAEVLKQICEESRVGKYMVKAYESDWCKAVGMASVSGFVALFLLLEVLRQWVRNRRGAFLSTDGQGKAAATAGGSESCGERDLDSMLTGRGQRVMQVLRTWDWCSILTKVNILIEVAMILIVGSKLTFVLFSWLNALLASVPLWIVVTLALGVGILMLLLPPVPGSAVYVFYGIVIVKQAKGSIGFWPAVLAASVLGLIAKLLGCCGQYLIGYYAGKSVQVQKTIGVDTVPTRAVEQILRQRGLSLGKVAILVGGPDWPTSVTCGILRLSVPQTLWGTCPVWFASIFPQTLVGALLVMEVGGDADYWSLVKTVATAVATFAQVAASGIAAHSITTTIERDHKELSLPRPEHEEVEKLTQRQVVAMERFKECTSWAKWGTIHKAVLFSAAALQLAGACVIAFDYILLQPICFRSFQMTSRIDASFADGGLEGSVLNLVIAPGGVLTLALMGLASVMHLSHSASVERAAHSLSRVHPT